MTAPALMASAVVAGHARQLPRSRGEPLQLVREDEWPATVATLNHHTKAVCAVAVWQDPANPARGIIASGSDDKTVMWVSHAQLAQSHITVIAQCFKPQHAAEACILCGGLQLPSHPHAPSMQSPLRPCPQRPPMTKAPCVPRSVCDLATGEVKLVLNLEGEVQGVAISGDGTCLVSGDSGGAVRCGSC